LCQEGYGVVFPDFPGCISAGDNYEDAFRMAHEALTGHVALIERDGDPIPEPRTLEEIKASWEFWSEWERDYPFLVGYVSLLPLTRRIQQVSVALDESLLAQIDRITSNRSAFLAIAAERMLEQEWR
jgi:predicted RNase H-like HicB family nuclease